MNLLEAIQSYRRFWDLVIIRIETSNRSLNEIDALKFAKISVSTLCSCEEIIENRLLDENNKFIF